MNKSMETGSRGKADFSKPAPRFSIHDASGNIPFASEALRNPDRSDVTAGNLVRLRKMDLILRKIDLFPQVQK